MSIANTDNLSMLGPGAVRHALVAERVRGYRCEHELAEATSKRLQGRRGRELAASVDRAAELAIALVDMGQAVPMLDACAEFDGRLLAAMDSALQRSRPMAMAVSRGGAQRRRPRGHGRRVVHG